MKNPHKIVAPLLAVVVCTLAADTLLASFHEPEVTAVSKPFANKKTTAEADKALQKFTMARKTGNIDEMIRYSYNLQSTDLKTLRQIYAAQHQMQPVQSTEITRMSSVGKTLVFASVETRYAHNLVIECMPVYNMDGHWKVIQGLPISSVITKSNPQQRTDKPVQEARITLTKFLNAARQGKIETMNQYILTDLRENNSGGTAKVPTSMREAKGAEYTITNIQAVDHAFAIASVLYNTPQSISVGRVFLYQTDGVWKIIAGVPGTSWLPLKFKDSGMYHIGNDTLKEDASN